MSFLKSLHVAAQGMRFQSSRMRVVSENIANADSAPTSPGQQPYRRKLATVVRPFDEMLGEKGLAPGRVREDRTAFKTKYEPGHPAADAAGNVKMPNVDTLVEQMDMREAQRSYEANLGVIGVTRRMITRTIDILRA